MSIVSFVCISNCMWDVCEMRICRCGAHLIFNLCSLFMVCWGDSYEKLIRRDAHFASNRSVNYQIFLGALSIIWEWLFSYFKRTEMYFSFELLDFKMSLMRVNCAFQWVTEIGGKFWEGVNKEREREKAIIARIIITLLHTIPSQTDKKKLSHPRRINVDSNSILFRDVHYINHQLERISSIYLSKYMSNQSVIFRRIPINHLSIHFIPLR